MKEMFLLIKYFTWKNYLGQSTWGNCLGASYLEDNYPGVIIRGTIIQTTIVRGQFFWRPFSGAIIWGGNYPGAIILGGELPPRQFTWGAIARGQFSWGPLSGGQLSGEQLPQGQLSGGQFPRTVTYNHTINLI